MNKQLTDKRLIEEFIQELDKRGYNFYILKGIRSLLRQEKKGGDNYGETKRENT